MCGPLGLTPDTEYRASCQHYDLYNSSHQLSHVEYALVESTFLKAFGDGILCGFGCLLGDRRFDVDVVVGIGIGIGIGVEVAARCLHSLAQ